MGQSVELTLFGSKISHSTQYAQSLGGVVKCVSYSPNADDRLAMYHHGFTAYKLSPLLGDAKVAAGGLYYNHYNYVRDFMHFYDVATFLLTGAQRPICTLVWAKHKDRFFNQVEIC